MKIDANMIISHDNGCKLGEIFVDQTWKRVRFKAGKRSKHNDYVWQQGGTFDSNDLKKISKIMDMVQKTVDKESLIEKIQKFLK